MFGQLAASIVCFLMGILLALAGNVERRRKKILYWCLLQWLSVVSFVAAAWLAFPRIVEAENPQFLVARGFLGALCITLPVFIGVAETILRRWRHQEVAAPAF